MLKKIAPKNRKTNNGSQDLKTVNEIKVFSPLGGGGTRAVDYVIFEARYHYAIEPLLPRAILYTRQ